MLVLRPAPTDEDIRDLATIVRGYHPMRGGELGPEAHEALVRGQLQSALRALQRALAERPDDIAGVEALWGPPPERTGNVEHTWNSSWTAPPVLRSWNAWCSAWNSWRRDVASAPRTGRPSPWVPELRLLIQRLQARDPRRRVRWIRDWIRRAILQRNNVERPEDLWAQTRAVHDAITDDVVRRRMTKGG